MKVRACPKTEPIERTAFDVFCDKEGEGKVNQQEQELMERYIYQVVRRLPKNQRKEVARELQELIGDMA